MRTKVTIIAIVSSCCLTALTVLVAAVWWMGWVGLLAWTGMAGAVIAVYLRFVAPWQARWGATDEEVRRTMPADEIIPVAASTTRAISIDRSPPSVWPWLIQIGYGRAGWYSYDWIDNDGHPSADRIIPELLDLRVGDLIEMLPGFGPKVVKIDAPRYLVAGDVEGGTWCLALYPDGEGSRLVSRWRQAWKTNSLAAKFFTLIAGPGAFLMEQKMLRGIKRRAEDNPATIFTPPKPSENPVGVAL